ncbi:Uncharacterized protein ANAPHAGO_00886 [Anaplasma phagocytophilum]|uniref:Uncharacterized protein n=1 Tax=Anaplasma phagocytophilum TaxID=948 RepID=A0A098GM18_ANAPH|nr:Uncharacterized protein ANAPHAGO_00886 [Anaplasma phagocytophilum]
MQMAIVALSTKVASLPYGLLSAVIRS